MTIRKRSDLTNWVLALLGAIIYGVFFWFSMGW